jgi:hypothetical protein
MATLDFSRAYVVRLEEIGSALLDTRKPGAENQGVARELLASAFDLCLRTGQDQLLANLDTEQPLTERGDLADHPRYLAALTTQLSSFDLDAGTPRQKKVKQLTEATLTALGLTVVDAADRSIAVDDSIRVAGHAAILEIATRKLSIPQVRDAIVYRARAGCDERFILAFDKIIAQLDERGIRLTKTPKVPLDALQAVQRLLADARNSVIDEVGRAGIDRVKALLEPSCPEAAARIDAPISLRLTPRGGAILRAQDPKMPMIPSAITDALMAGLVELVPIAWRAPERVARPYGATQTFAVGELIEHPKFGLGTVKTVAIQRIDVEFTDGPHTLVHRGVK